MNHGVTAVTLLGVCFVLCWLGKLAYGVFHPRTRMDRELTARDNVAFAIPLGGYYLGILIALGGPLSGPSSGDLLRDALSVAGWGILAMLLLNVSSVVSQHLLLRHLNLTTAILEEENVAAGIVVAGSHVASALLILGALGGEGGFLPAAVFWVYAQVLLALAVTVFLRTVNYDLGAEIRRQNRAVALSMAGVLVAMGNVLRMSVAGSFEGWASGFIAATGYAVVGLALLFAARLLTDRLLLPGVTIRHEVLEQEIPNVGVGYLEALFYIGTSLLIGWSL